MRTGIVIAALGALLGSPGTLGAQERVEYVALPLSDLLFEEGSRPADTDPVPGRARWRFDPFLETRIRMDDRGAQAFVLDSESPWRLTDMGEYLRDTRVAMRLPSVDATGGTLLIQLDGEEKLSSIRFQVPSGASTEGARSEFLGARADHYASLREGGHAGAAWFRVLEARDREALGSGEPGAMGGARRRFTRSDPSLYQMFSGGRAVAENLRLDRDLNDVLRGEELDLVASLAEIEGIEVAEMDWSERLVGLTPDLDRLATVIPADQHAVFFPSFASFVEIHDAAQGRGLSLAGALDPRGGGGDLLGFYGNQLGIELDQLARILGSKAVESLALTGSDPYVRTGTDVALWIEPRLEQALYADLAARQERAAAAAGVELEEGTLGRAQWRGAQSIDRTFSSYLVRVEGLLLLSNSRAQVERCLALFSEPQAHPSLASLDEYRWFRHRYGVSNPGEDAFAFLSDPTIRRWSSPRWRIGAARRTRAAAILADTSAEEARWILEGGGEERIHEEEVALPGGDSLWIGPAGVRSSTYGTQGFLTPIAELGFDRVSEAEKNAYDRFRETYQRQWRTVFDPIGVSIAVDRGQFDLDLTILPLIGNSDYREFKDIAGWVRLTDGSGDPHGGSAVNFAVALDRGSRHFGEAEDLLRGFLTGKAALGWVGDHVSVYADEDPFWTEWAEAEDRDTFIEERFYEVPVALHVDVRDPLRLAAFLVGARGFLDSITGDMLVWEPREHEGRSYTRIGLDEDVDLDVQLEDAAIYYASTREAWVVSMREDMVQRALARNAVPEEKEENGDGFATEAAETGNVGPEGTTPPDGNGAFMLREGASVSLEISLGGLRAIEMLAGDEVAREHLHSSWRNLDVLDSLARHFPDRDPLETYSRLFGMPLACPSGGEYVFDPRVGGFVSSHLGAPGHAPNEVPLPVDLEALEGGAFSMTFEEDDGLRVRAAVRAKGR